MIQWFSNLLGKALMVAEQNPLPCLVVTTAVPFDPGSPVSDKNPLPCVLG